MFPILFRVFLSTINYDDMVKRPGGCVHTVTVDFDQPKK